MNYRIFLFAAPMVVATAVVALSHGGATGIVKQRMDGMTAMGKALTAVGDMFKGKAEFNPEQISRSADIVREHAVKMEELFPDTKESKTGTGTEALPVIWEKKDEFLDIARELDKQAAVLKQVSQTGDKRKIRIEFAKVSRTCAACHTDFRKPKK